MDIIHKEEGDNARKKAEVGIMVEERRLLTIANQIFRFAFELFLFAGRRKLHSNAQFLLDPCYCHDTLIGLRYNRARCTTTLNYHKMLERSKM